MLKEIKDKKIWEEFVLKNNEYTFIQSWTWGTFMHVFGKEQYRLGYYENESLQGIAQVTVERARRGHFLHLRHFPLLDWSKETLVQNFFNELIAFAREKNLWFIRFSPLVDNLNLRALLPGYRVVSSAIHDVDAELTWVLDIQPSEEELLSGMKKNTRYAIRKAEKEGVKIKSTNTLEFFEDFWFVFTDTISRNKYTGYSKKFVKEGFELFAKEGRAKMYVAQLQGKIIAAAIFTYFGDTAFYYHSGQLTEYRNIPASYLIQWQAIKDERQNGIKYHNFWGIAPLKEENGAQSKVIEKHPWSGLSFFKLGFGGVSHKFMHAHDIPLNWRWIGTYLYEVFERKLSGF